jgi:hypothetical protein
MWLSTEWVRDQGYEVTWAIVALHSSATQRMRKSENLKPSGYLAVYTITVQNVGSAADP